MKRRSQRVLVAQAEAEVGLLQALGDRMIGVSLIERLIELAPPDSERSLFVSHRLGTIDNVVDETAVRVHVIKMLVQPPRKQPRNHVEILVVVRREPARIALSLFGCTTFRRKIAGDL